jgi:hypothetical protein
MRWRRQIKQGEAGWSAAERYRTSLRQWRKRNLMALRLTFWPIMGLLAILSRNAVASSEFWLGFGLATAVTMYATLSDFAPEYIERWGDGAKGEIRTGEELEKLRAHGYLFRHDLDGPSGNLDHLVVGPPGVFLLDSKMWHGRVIVGGRNVRVERGHDGLDNYSARESLIRAKQSARRLSTEMKHRTGKPIWVRAVLVIWGDFSEGVRKVGHVTLVRGDLLVNWLQDQPKRFPPEKYRAAVGFLQTARPADRIEGPSSSKTPA